MTVTMFLGSLSITVDHSSTTSITVSLTLYDETATEYTISYSNIDCPDDIYDDITDINFDDDTMYTLTDLEEGTEYSITVTVTLE